MKDSVPENLQPRGEIGIAGLSRRTFMVAAAGGAAYWAWAGGALGAQGRSLRPPAPAMVTIAEFRRRREEERQKLP